MEAVLITGASSGIGADAAKLFSENNYEVILCGRDSSRLEKVASTLPGPKHILAGDLTDEKYRKSIVQFIKAGHLKSPLKNLVNNAGVYTPHKSSIEITEEKYREQFEVNFLACVLLTNALYPILKSNPPSSIVNISSTLGLKPMPGTAHYSALKAALISWTECMALEWAPEAIRVNCICPGLVETPIHHADFSDPKVRKSMDEIQPIGRAGVPRDISEAILFLSSPRSSWTTGSVLSVDGGVRLV